MLTAMNDEFSHRFEETQQDTILQKLKESFDTSDDVEQYRVSYAIYNAQMYEGALFTNHVLYMIKQFEHLSKLGYPLHEQFGKMRY